MIGMLNRLSMIRISLGHACCAALAAFFVIAFSAPLRADAAESPKLAYLGTFLQNDNEGLEPTTDAERQRLVRTGEEFTRLLADSGAFAIAPVSAQERTRIKAGQLPGECGGCEIEYGKTAGADVVAWIRVQKVSNLILNMNVYITDVATGRALLIKSVDLRGNTDDSWSRSLKYLVKNRVLPANIKPSSS